jgi:hypothetical protein
VFISVIAYNDVNVEYKYDTYKQQNILDKEIKNYETIDKEPPTIKVYNHKNKKVQNIDIEEYLYGVLSGEMSAKFNIEALKAQAIAARTFTIYNKEQGKKHKDAVVCTDYTHCQEYKSEEELLKTNGEKWINEFEIDGIRLDVAYCMEPDFFRQLRNFVDSKKEDFWLMGEMVHGDYRRLIAPELLDSVTNYECYKGI